MSSCFLPMLIPISASCMGGILEKKKKNYDFVEEWKLFYMILKAYGTPINMLKAAVQGCNLHCRSFSSTVCF